ncbi:high-affinity nicotinic acid transporter [Rhizoctonia solani 123E]|uniref:High-affinity nicotinic acid transporter n=1 Tax=Rhizoctonia solani 123E TaxID=1423351 RepID=A0A074SXV2_9AGAM|nr:high-affinity nicotinic acid transporter [Rhizoctonia solani 123E]
MESTHYEVAGEKGVQALHEKRDSVHSIETGAASSGVGFSPADTKRLLGKLDRRILPWMAGLFLLSYLDRSNIGNARLDGLEKDLGLHGLQFNNALAIFYPFYVISEVPSNMILKRTRASFMVSWGTIMTLMGLVKNYTGLMIARTFLGIAEGGLFPGIAFYITLWYQRSETGTRMAIYYAAATVAGAFGGLLARGIGEMRGVGGLKGWSWIFILEGLLTIIIAMAAYFFIPDHPSTARFLTPTEQAEVIRRLDDDNCHLSRANDMGFFWDAVKDWKTYAYMLIFIACTTPTYSLALFLPTIISNMGYTAERSQLLSVPPYVLACILTVTAGITADRLKTRGRFMVGCFLLAIVGFAMLIASTTPAVQYTAVFVASAGAFPNVAMCMSWCGNNFGGAMKRSVAIAMIVAFGNLGGLIASYTYISKNSPRYYSGHGTLIGVLALGAVVSLIVHIFCRRENKRRDRAYKAPELYTEDELKSESRKGDSATFFRFVD